MEPTKRAIEVWGRLCGMFGGDAVARKYGDVPPDEWTAVLARLNSYQLERALRRLVYSGKAHVPTLPEFMRLAREVRNEDLDEPQAHAQLALPSWSGDVWDVKANHRLLAYIMRSMHAKPRKYGHPGDYDPMIGPINMPRYMHEATAILVEFKKAWSRDMREWSGEPTAAEQEHHWRDDMALAEAEIKRLAPAELTTHA